MKAQDAIRLGHYDPADYNGVFQLYMQAYGDVELAQKAKRRALEEYVDRKCNNAQHR